MPRRPLWLVAFVFLTSPALADDVAIQLDVGDALSVRNSTGTIERLRVDEATGNMSRNGSLFVHTTGVSSTFVGASSGASANGSGNAGFGHRALRSNTSGSQNTAAGAFALQSNATGFSNTAVGAFALDANTVGFNNTVTGAFALRRNTTGVQNSASGTSALGSNTTGGSNTAAGAFALYANTTGGDNASFGAGALRSNKAGSGNVAFGRYALQNSTGSDNVALGRYAGSGQTSGGSNIYLANVGVAGESGQIKIGTVGTHTQTTVAGISGATSAGGIAVLVDASGVLGTTTSSARFKQDVRDMGDASDVLMRLRPVTFRYTEEAVGKEGAKTPQYGLIAEEVAEVAPELVAPDLEGRPYSVKYHELPALLLGQSQTQQRTIETQARRIAAQDEVIATLAARLERLEGR